MLKSRLIDYLKVVSAYMNDNLISIIRLIKYMFSYINFLKIMNLYYFLKIFAREWFFTTNHKKLGLNYLIFSSISGLFGTILATLIRLELAQPNSLIFANKANAYHVVVGMHAIIMVFFSNPCSIWWFW